MRYSHHLKTTEYLDIMHSSGLVPLINRPTRVTHQSATLIDHIFTNNINQCENMLQGILLTDITDHYPIFHMCCISNVNSSNSDEDIYYCRRINNKNKQQFKISISELNWNNVISKHLCNDAFNIFYAQMKECYYKAFPLIKCKRKTSKCAPWITDGLLGSIKFKNKLYKKKIQHPTAFNISEYNKYRNKLTTVLRKQVQLYYESRIQNSKDNLTRMWNIIKTVINKHKSKNKHHQFLYNNQLITDDKEISEQFNKYFSEIGTSLSRNIPRVDKHFSDYLKGNFENSIYLKEITTGEIVKIVNNLKNGSPGLDDISANPIKCVINDIIVPLQHICTLSLSQGCFPDILKSAKTIPLFKSGEKALFNNYRPISLLPLFSKILERIMYDRVYDFLVKYGILYLFQFGFRKSHSTYMALLCMLDKLYSALDRGDYALGIFIDFRKAFDTVDHRIILHKLYYYGIRGTAYDWFNDYLQNRSQFVSYNDVNSTCRKMTCGVPQGSILGPLLFLIYINDMAYVSDKLYSVLFADDTNMFASNSNLNALIYEVNTELNKVVSWQKPSSGRRIYLKPKRIP